MSLAEMFYSSKCKFATEKQNDDLTFIYRRSHDKGFNFLHDSERGNFYYLETLSSSRILFNICEVIQNIYCQVLSNLFRSVNFANSLLLFSRIFWK